MPNYLDDSDPDESPLKNEPTSGENLTHLVGNEKSDTDSDDGSAEDSSSECLFQFYFDEIIFTSDCCSFSDFS